MKKMIIAIVAAIMATVLMAKTTVTVGTNEVDAVKYATEQSEKVIKWLNGSWKEVDKDILVQCDRILAAKGTEAGFNYKNIFPLCLNNYIENSVKAKMTDQAYQFAKMYATNTCNITKETFRKYSMFVVSECLCFRKFVTENERKGILKNAPMFAKMAIRKQGKSFVDKDGTSPVKIYVDAIANSLNAKRMEGFNNAVKAIGMDFGFKYEEYLLQNTELEDLKQKIFSGEIDFNDNKQRILRTHLGVEEYNSFVKTYNDGEMQ